LHGPRGKQIEEAVLQLIAVDLYGEYLSDGHVLTELGAGQVVKLEDLHQLCIRAPPAFMVAELMVLPGGEAGRIRAASSPPDPDKPR
jgi:hypothetical protein